MGERIQIGICDDEKYQMELIENTVLRVAADYGFQCTLQKLNTPEEVLQWAENLDLLFLDVEMPGMDGFEIAERIRMENKDLKIVFVTSHMEFVQKAFRHRAYRYLYKPVDEGDMREVFAGMEWDMLEESGIDIYTREGMWHLLLKKIIHIESLGEGICIYYEDGSSIITDWKLKDIQEKLSDSFFQCHKSHIINFWLVKNIGAHDVIMLDDTVIPVATRRNKGLKKAYMDFFAKHGKYM